MVDLVPVEQSEADNLFQAHARVHDKGELALDPRLGDRAAWTVILRLFFFVMNNG